MTTSTAPTKGLTYAESGVHIDEAERFLQLIKPMLTSIARPWVTPGQHGFTANIDLAVFGRVLGIPGLSGTVKLNVDGVGTKLKIALAMGKLDTIGIDLVAMEVNDAIREGAVPIALADYYGVGKLKAEVGAEIIKGIAEGCHQAGIPIAAGETAELRIIYHGDDFDLVGTTLSAVDPALAAHPDPIREGDTVIGLLSDGFSNGLSMVNTLLGGGLLSLDDPCDGTTFGEAVLRPTTIFVDPVKAAMRTGLIKKAVHVTGGGLIDKPGSILPPGRSMNIHGCAIGDPLPPVFEAIQKAGNVDDREMRNTFNCGIGMLLVTTHYTSEVDKVLNAIQRSGFPYMKYGTVGRIEKQIGEHRVTFYR